MSTIETLHKANQLSTELFNGHARAAGVGHITQRQASLLLAIAELTAQSGPPNQAACGAIAAADRSTLTEMMRRLGTAGLVKRVKSKYDARAWVVTLTAAGTKLLPKLQSVMDATEADLNSRIKGLDKLRIQPAQAVPARMAAE